MISFDKRFFDLKDCVFERKTNTLTLNFLTRDNFEPQIPTHERACVKQIRAILLDTDALTIEFTYTAAPERFVQLSEGALAEKLADLAASIPASVAAANTRVDKTSAAKNIEYYLGKPVHVRPIMIKYLKVGRYEQATAGIIKFLKKREYKRTEKDGTEVTKSFYSFVLDDYESQVSCAYFPTTNTRAKFEKLTEKTAIAVIGVYEERKGYTSMRVVGISFCDL